MDLPKNFSKGTVSTGYNSAAVSIVLNAGDGAKFPTTPFDFVWWNFTDYPDPTDDPNVEIGRCTARTTDTLTITRAAQGTAAANHNTAGKTYKIALGPLAQTITDIKNLYPNGAPLWNVKHINKLYQNNSFSTGENDVYTCPTGKKALVLTMQFFNSSGSSPNVICKMKVSGTYYRASATTAINNGTSTSIRAVIPLEAGDSLSLNFSTGIACNVAIAILEFDSVAPVKFVRLLGTLINGDNTLYTCPAGYTATPLSLIDFSKSGSTGTGSLNFANDSGGSLTLVTNVVPSGGSVSANNKFSSQAASNAAVTAPTAPFNLEAGDFVSINSGSNSANQAAWAIFFESPLPE